MPYRQIVFTCGYAEDQQLSLVVFQKQYGEHHETITETLTDFATELFNLWWDSEGNYNAEKACRHCGAELPDYKIRYDKIVRNFSAWIASLSSFTNDTLAEGPCWNTWLVWKQIAAVPVEETVEIVEMAELILPSFVDMTDFDGYYKELKNRYHGIADQFCVAPVDALRFSISPRDQAQDEAAVLEEKNRDKRSTTDF